MAVAKKKAPAKKTAPKKTPAKKAPAKKPSVVAGLPANMPAPKKTAGKPSLKRIYMMVDVDEKGKVHRIATSPGGVWKQ